MAEERDLSQGPVEGEDIIEGLVESLRGQARELEELADQIEQGTQPENSPPLQHIKRQDWGEKEEADIRDGASHFQSVMTGLIQDGSLDEGVPLYFADIGVYMSGVPNAVEMQKEAMRRALLSICGDSAPSILRPYNPETDTGKSVNNFTLDGNSPEDFFEGYKGVIGKLPEKLTKPARKYLLRVEEIPTQNTGIVIRKITSVLPSDKLEVYQLAKL